MIERKLLAIVSTDEDNRIRCQHNGCNHPVYKAKIIYFPQQQQLDLHH